MFLPHLIPVKDIVAFCKPRTVVNILIALPRDCKHYGLDICLRFISKYVNIY